MLRLEQMKSSLTSLNQQPTRLGKEPLLDAIFEIRFDSTAPASSVFPGLLYANLSGEKTLERLPAADIPQAIRSIDPNLQFAPVGRVAWGNFYVLYSDKSIAIACKMPYSGWDKFKPAIEEVVKQIENARVIHKIDKVSLKYADLIERVTFQEQLEAINLNVVVAGQQLKTEPFQLRVQVERSNWAHSIQLLAGMTVSLAEGGTRSGLIVETDTFKIQNNMQMDEFVTQCSGMLDEMHSSNKEVFFDLLTTATLESLEPMYDTTN
jgi:uncharacterized protein (TIGR04255 family)